MARRVKPIKQGVLPENTAQTWNRGQMRPRVNYQRKCELFIVFLTKGMTSVADDSQTSEAGHTLE